MKSVLCALLMVACTVSYAIAQDQPGLNAGIKAPDFTATNHLGKKIQLSQFYKNGPVVLVFYRGGWCPYCNLQLNDLQSKINEFNAKNATIIAVSIDKASKSAETANKNNLDFDVIGNPGGDILKAYDLVYQVPDDLAKKYKEEYNIDLEAASGRTDHVIAIPATYIIDTTGTITFAYANEDYKVRPSPGTILQELEKLGAPATPITFIPINHATMIIQSGSLDIYVDPVGDPAVFAEFNAPGMILLTDTHYDHLDPAVVGQLRRKDTIVVGPKAVIDQLGSGEILHNGESKTFNGVNVEAIPMYNLTPERLVFHEKGRGNGYVITLNGKRIYISGDTEDIPEMRALKNIDYAFVCMNLPYTMTEEQAASAVLEFKPKVVFPYHYRGKDMISDIEKFKNLVAKNPNIEVRFLDWY